MERFPPRLRRLRFSSFDLDLDTRVLTGPFGDAYISPMPYALLLALTEDPGRTLSRPELIIRLWPGDRSEGLEERLDFHVRRLRRFFRHAAVPPVQVVRGVGLRFSVSVAME